MTLQVWAHQLRKAATDWEGQGDDLHGAGRTLAGADTSLLGSRVAPVATTFLTTWGDRIEALRRQANTNAEQLEAAAADFSASDRHTVEAMQRLLSWEDRDARPLGPGRVR